MAEIETLPLFDIREFDESDPEVQDHIHGVGCQHPDREHRDATIVSGMYSEEGVEEQA